LLGLFNDDDDDEGEENKDETEANQSELDTMDEAIAIPKVEKDEPTVSNTKASFTAYGKPKARWIRSGIEVSPPQKKVKVDYKNAVNKTEIIKKSAFANNNYGEWCNGKWIKVQDAGPLETPIDENVHNEIDANSRVGPVRDSMGRFSCTADGRKRKQSSETLEETVVHEMEKCDDKKLNELKEIERKKKIQVIKKELQIKREAEKNIKREQTKARHEMMKHQREAEESHKDEKRREIEGIRQRQREAREAERRRRQQKLIEKTIAHKMANVTTINPPIMHVDYEIYDEDQLDEKINEMIVKTAALYTCAMCGKATSGKSMGKRQNLRDHIEARHVVGVSHYCQVCGAEAKTRNSLRMHMANYHKVKKEK
jgi:hypothetical protein